MSHSELSVKKRLHFDVRTITKIGILSALSIAVMLFEIPLPFAPPFYKLDLSEIFIMLGGFALGPTAAVCIEFIKILLNLMINGTSTAGVGELANFLIGCSMVVPASIIFRKMPNFKGAVIAGVTGTLILTVVGSLLNAFVLLPAYAYFYGMPMDALIGMGTAVNPAIDNLGTFVFFAVVPFNLLKGVVVSIAMCLLYKRLIPILQK